MNAEYASMCAEFDAAEDLPKAQAAAPMGLFDGLISRLRSAWKAAGGSVLSFWTWLPVIIELISILGPKIQEIVKLILDAIGRGETPKTFDAATAAVTV